MEGLDEEHEKREDVQVFIPFQSIRGCFLNREEPVQTCWISDFSCVLEDGASF